MIIGRFNQSDDGTLYGHIRTMFFKSDKVVFEPVASGTEKTPSFHIYTADEIELGAAWRQANKETGAISYDVKLDDPTFASPIRCLLARSKKGDGYVLVWERKSAMKAAA